MRKNNMRKIRISWNLVKWTILVFCWGSFTGYFASSDLIHYIAGGFTITFVIVLYQLYMEFRGGK